MKALFISYFYPPIGTVGTVRITKFIKFLHRLGYSCSVLTIKNVVHQTLDESLEHDIPSDVKIYRTFHLEPRTFYRQKAPVSGAEFQSGWSLGFKKTLISWTQKTLKFLLLPDELIFWAPFAIFRGIQIVRRDHIDVIFSSSPPPTVHIIAYFIKFFTGVPWVSDFRDEWANDPGNQPPTRFHRTLNGWMERSVVSKSDSVAVVTPSIYDEMGSEYKNHPNKFTIIPNGFDDEDISTNPNNKPPTNKLTITYSGTFYQHQTPYYFFRALKELSSDGLVHLEDLRFVMYGNIVTGTIGVDILNDTLFLPIVFIHPYQPHDQLCSLLLNTDILFLVISSKFGWGTFSGKLFEYLGARRFIFGLVPTHGLAADIIRETKSGVAVEPENIPQIKETFLTVYRQWKENSFHLNPNEAEISKYTRRQQAEQLFRIFNKVTGVKPAGK